MVVPRQVERFVALLVEDDDRFRLNFDGFCFLISKLMVESELGFLHVLLFSSQTLLLHFF